jgi:hypothetical protein
VRSWRSIALIVGATACGGSQTVGPSTEGGSAVTTNIVPFDSLDDAGVTACTMTPATGAEVYAWTATASGLSGTCVGSIPASWAWKTGASGTACTDPLDCLPVCCACASAWRSRDVRSHFVVQRRQVRDSRRGVLRARRSVLGCVRELHGRAELWKQVTDPDRAPPSYPTIKARRVDVWGGAAGWGGTQAAAVNLRK